MSTKFLQIIPVLPSADISRDCDWYKTKAGFDVYYSDQMYAVLYRDTLCLHLQWHADTKDDPLLGGSVIRINASNVNALFEEFVQRETVKNDALRLQTPWGTNEFGFYDLNGNAIFIMEDAQVTTNG